jgi:hypothetical protein
VKIEVVTTFNEKLYDVYAKDFLETYNWPYKLNVVTEDGFSDSSYDVNWLDPSHDHIEFIERHRDQKFGEVGYYLHDGVRFCHMVFAYTDLALRGDLDYLIFFDADVVFKKPLPENELFELFYPDSEALFGTYIRRNEYAESFGGPSWVETGSMFFNLRNPKCIEFLSELRELYASNEIWEHELQADSYAVYILIEKYEKEGNRFFDLCDGIPPEKWYSPMQFCPKATLYWQHNKGMSAKFGTTESGSKFYGYT